MWKTLLLLACMASSITFVYCDDDDTKPTANDTDETKPTGETGPLDSVGDSGSGDTLSCAPICQPNEEYSSCTNGGCDARNCSQVGKPVPCVKLAPEACIKGCVCVAGYLRAANGTCVPKEQCTPKCTGQNEYFDNCIKGCSDQMCDSIGKIFLCPLQKVCKSGCRCNPGFYRNADNVCVPECECPLNCPVNEEYSTCTNSGCTAKNCSQIGKPVPCIRIDPKYCIKGCVCVAGYLRDANGKCVPKDQCTPKCVKPNEVYDVCPAPCPPKLCSVNEATIKCKAPPKPGDKECKPGCRCADFYYRNATGTCVPKNECEQPLTCDRPNEVYDRCPAVCPPQECGVNPALILCLRNPDYGDSRCKPGCVCQEGYVRNATRDCIPRDECPKCTGQNEYWDNCIQGCSNQTCDSIGKTYHCPLQKGCKSGCRCNPGFYRNADNVCVPESECRCGDDPNAHPGCGVNCGKTCASYKSKNPICPLYCNLNGCDCNDGFVFDANLKKCVLPKDCTPICGLNERFDSCVGFGCGYRNCSQLGQPQLCIDPAPGACKNGCTCVKGYLRAENGTCVPQDQCPQPGCGGDPNAQKGCGYNCGRKCSTYKIKNKSLLCPRIECKPDKCDCKDGFVFDDNLKKCVRPEECTPTCKVNEQYSSCVNSGCSAKNCSQVGKPVPCVDPVTCIKGCVCVKGYLRAANGTCVPQDQCTPTCSGQNEYFDNCIQGCSNQSCSDIGQTFSCPAELVGQCKSGCRCKPGFWRNNSNVCVSQDDCPKPNCPDGEVWEWCPTVKCDGDYCAKTKDSPQTCPVGIVCDKPRCICGYNRKRDWKTGKCIPIPDCPPFKCDCNQEYKACPEQCYEESCYMYVNKTKCIPFKIGIIANCRPQCLCRKGYYKNSAGACVAPYECSTDCPQA